MKRKLHLCRHRVEAHNIAQMPILTFTRKLGNKGLRNRLLQSYAFSTETPFPGPLKLDCYSIDPQLKCCPNTGRGADSESTLAVLNTATSTSSAYYTAKATSFTAYTNTTRS